MMTRSRFTRNNHNNSHAQSNQAASPVKRRRNNPHPIDTSKTQSDNGANGKLGRHKLTIRQERFARLFDGDGTATCRLAGYAGTDEVLAVQATSLLKNAKVVAYIEARERATVKIVGDVANRVERQEFWTKVMLGITTLKALGGKASNDDDDNKPAAMKDRLKASELLGRSQCDFIEKKMVGNLPGESLEVKLTLGLLERMSVKQLKQFKELMKEAK